MWHTITATTMEEKKQVDHTRQHGTAVKKQLAAFLTPAELAVLGSTSTHWRGTVQRATASARAYPLTHVPMSVALPATDQQLRHARLVDTLTLRGPGPLAGPFQASRLALSRFPTFPRPFDTLFPRVHTLRFRAPPGSPGGPLPGVVVLDVGYGSPMHARSFPDVAVLGMELLYHTDDRLLAEFLPQLKALVLNVGYRPSLHVLGQATDSLTRLSVIGHNFHRHAPNFPDLPNLRHLRVGDGTRAVWGMARRQPYLEKWVVRDLQHGWTVDDNDPQHRNQGMPYLTAIGIEDEAHHSLRHWFAVWAQCPRLQHIYVTNEFAYQALQEGYVKHVQSREDQVAWTEERNARRKAVAAVEAVVAAARRNRASPEQIQADEDLLARVRQAAEEHDHVMPWTVHLVDLSHPIFHPVPELDIKWQLD